MIKIMTTKVCPVVPKIRKKLKQRLSFMKLSKKLKLIYNIPNGKAGGKRNMVEQCHLETRF